MTRALNIQTCGSLIVVAAFAASEGAALLVERHPGWPIAWQLNLGVFHVFETARVATSSLRFLFHSSSLAVALLLIGVIVLVRAIRFRFGVALFANLGFVAALALAHAWTHEFPSQRAASLIAVKLSVESDGILVGTMLLVSTIACVVSHLSFAEVMRQGRRRRLSHDGTGFPVTFRQVD